MNEINKPQTAHSRKVDVTKTVGAQLTAQCRLTFVLHSKRPIACRASVCIAVFFFFSLILDYFEAFECPVTFTSDILMNLRQKKWRKKNESRKYENCRMPANTERKPTLAAFHNSIACNLCSFFSLLDYIVYRAFRVFPLEERSRTVYKRILLVFDMFIFSTDARERKNP